MTFVRRYPGARIENRSRLRRSFRRALVSEEMTSRRVHFLHARSTDSRSSAPLVVRSSGEDERVRVCVDDRGGGRDA